MTATMHKIMAGNGYLYLVKQVASGDQLHSHMSLADYYSVRGEAPGHWFGAGCTGLDDIRNAVLVPNAPFTQAEQLIYDALPGVDDQREPGAHLAGSRVSESQMRALFGLGYHPDAEELMKIVMARTHSEKQATRAAKLGRAFIAAPQEKPGDAQPQFQPDQQTSFQEALTNAFRAYRQAHNLGFRDQIPTVEKARIRTEVGTKCYLERYGRQPLDMLELGGFMAREMRGPRQSVAAYDITFSPVKSVSVLWALADQSVSVKINELHDEAVKETLEWFEKNFLFTRQGTDGVEQVETRGAIIALFTHRDSRAGDPDLHTHATISNKVQAVDGSWLTIDGTILHRAVVSLSEHYNMLMRNKLTLQMGLKWHPEMRQGKRPVYELNGIDQGLREQFSQRDAMIRARQAQLTQQFQDMVGRPPTTEEAFDLREQANHETREAKHEPRTFAQQQAVWRQQAAAYMGAQQVGRMIEETLDPALNQPSDMSDPNAPYTLDIPAGANLSIVAMQHLPAADRSEEALDREVCRILRTSWRIGRPETLDWFADRVLERITASQATFQATHMVNEATRLVNDAGIPADAQEAFIPQVAQRAQQRAICLARPDMIDVPDSLRRSDGVSIYRKAYADLYTTQQILDAEDFIIGVAGQTNGLVVRDVDVAIALVHSEADGKPLNPMQRALLEDFTQSGKRAGLALAPAGTGKTTVMRAVGDAWANAGGTVVGLSHQAEAAKQLREAFGGNTACDTIASLTYQLHALEAGINPADVSLPRWARNVNAKTLIVVDEAGMASTLDLARLIHFAAERGASVRLIGDDRQLASIGAGGVLRAIAAEHGSVTLNELKRFRNVAEGQATLALREGSHEALGFYFDAGRVHPVNPADPLQWLFNDWCRDITAGLNSVMLAFHLDDVRALNQAARQWRLDTNQIRNGPAVTLRDGLVAGVGDVIASRQNDKWLKISRTDWVKNRDRWLVRKVNRNGSLDVVSMTARRRITLPADYVANNVELGYASTFNGAQGINVDTGKVLFRGDETRNASYVATTRGSIANDIYVCVGTDADPEKAIFEDAVWESTAREILEQILDRTGDQLSATSAKALAADPIANLSLDAGTYNDLLGRACEALLPGGNTDQLTFAADQIFAEAGYQTWPKLSESPAWDALKQRLALIYAAGTNPIRALQAVLADNPLTATNPAGRANDPAAVLHWRLSNLVPRNGPLPWLDGLPDKLANNPVWGSPLHQAAQLVTAEAQAVIQDVAGWEPATAPRWAQPLLQNQPALVTDIAVWRAANRVPDNEICPLGRPPSGVKGRAATTWRQMDTRLRQAVGAAWIDSGGTAHPGVWDADLPAEATADPMWPLIAARLDNVAQTIGQPQVHQLLHNALAFGPLPDETPAAALWWRFTDQYRGPAQQDITATRTHRLHPVWEETLLARTPLGARSMVVDSPAWPHLVIAVDATPDQWREQIIDQAVAIVAGMGIPSDAYTLMLADTITRLTTPPETSEQATPDLADLAPEADDQAWNDQQNITRDTRQPAAPPDEENQPSDADRAWLDQQTTTTTRLTSAPLPADVEPADPETLPPDPAEQPAPRAGAGSEPVWPTSPQRCLDLVQEAANWYQRFYKNSPAARYMASRFGSDLADDPRFIIGYAPNSATGLVKHLRATMGATDQELLDAGLANRKEETGFVYDAMRDRAVIALTDNGGHPIGFTGRTLGDDTRKYVNTRTTPVFKKGQILFGQQLFDPAKTVVLAEGAMDAIAITLAGAGQAIGVAPCGTALTQAQVDLLQPTIAGRTMLVATDNDPAGWAAAAKDYPMLQAAGATPRRLETEGKDPAEMWLLNPQQLQAQLANPDQQPHLAGALYTHQIRQNIARTNPGWQEGQPVPEQFWNEQKNHLHYRGGADQMARDLFGPLGPQDGITEFQKAAQTAFADTSSRQPIDPDLRRLDPKRYWDEAPTGQDIYARVFNDLYDYLFDEGAYNPYPTAAPPTGQTVSEDKETSAEIAADQADRQAVQARVLARYGTLDLDAIDQMRAQGTIPAPAEPAPADTNRPEEPAPDAAPETPAGQEPDWWPAGYKPYAVGPFAGNQHLEWLDQQAHQYAVKVGQVEAENKKRAQHGWTLLPLPEQPLDENGRPYIDPDHYVYREELDQPRQPRPEDLYPDNNIHHGPRLGL